MKCVIIAAGRGSRLSAHASSKPLLSVLGVPLIERVIRDAANGGATEFCVVTGYRGDAVESHLRQLASALPGVPIGTVANREWELGNGLSVLSARDCEDGNFLLLMADHLFDPAIIQRLVQLRPRSGDVHLAVDFGLTDNDRIDLEDVTRVLVRDGVVIDIGKGISDYNGYDTGLFHCTQGLFQALEASAAGGDTSLSGGMRILCAAGRVRSLDMEDTFWMDVDDEAALSLAERLLRQRESRD
ncbi:MAG TPA: nucleotidyltransferase [Candidatus Latescibacteria bacterium]|nr:nucleotidyltransferase [Candidatus Latescibacterota bacterium]